MNESCDVIAPEKSTFVTVLAVIFIVLAGVLIIGLILQIILYSLIYESFQISESLNEQISRGSIPVLAGFILSHMHLFLIFSLAVSLVTLIAGIGLLMRKNWARIIFIFIMLLAIAWQVFGFVSQWFITPGLPDVPRSVGQNLRLVIMFARVFSFFITSGFCFLFGWIIYKLTSEKIRREFIPDVSFNPSLIN
jgi:hypothetical protein